MTKNEAISEALKRSMNYMHTAFYVFYNDNIPSSDWQNRYQVSEWVNRPNDKPSCYAYKGTILECSDTTRQEI